MADKFIKVTMSTGIILYVNIRHIESFCKHFEPDNGSILFLSVRGEGNATIVQETPEEILELIRKAGE